jgi:oxygen-independent coproporphyrinogen-3 oxidase
MGKAKLTSIYLGGGTPSLWQPEAVGNVIDRLCTASGTDLREVEITLECNPSSFDVSRCQKWHDSGVNRLSLGLQSLKDADLQYLGRLHTARQGSAALGDALKSGIPRVCVDLMFGLPSRTPEDVLDEIRQLPLSELSHLSVYALTIEPNTVLGAKARAGCLLTAPEDSIADTFLAIHEELSSRGFEHYEISNFARPGQMSLHNSSYWKGRDYLGLGVAAWGTVHLVAKGSSCPNAEPRLRYRNTSRTERYLDLCRNGSPEQFWMVSPSGILAECEPIDDYTALTERLMLGLRTKEGINFEELEAEFDIKSWLTQKQAILEKLVRRGRLVHSGVALTIPFETWFLADGTIASLI